MNTHSNSENLAGESERLEEQLSVGGESTSDRDHGDDSDELLVGLCRYEETTSESVRAVRKALRWVGRERTLESESEGDEENGDGSEGL